MILFKNRADTLEQVLANSKHASNTIPNNANHGDIILIAQTMGTLRPNEKSIRYIMRYDRAYEDTSGESLALWGRQWKYIISGYNVQPVEPFNLEDIQVSEHNYKPIMTHCNLRAEDESAVLDWIFESEISLVNYTDTTGVEFSISAPDDSALLEKIDSLLVDAPDYKRKVSSYLNRPSNVRSALIRVKGTDCQICGSKGFQKKNSSDNYCEVHHMIELNNNAPKTLQSWNLVVVCPTCHKRLHYGNVSSRLSADNKWEISFDSQPFIQVR